MHTELDKLTTARSFVDTTCTRCGRCEKGCAFLKAYGTPGEIARKIRDIPHDQWPNPFECSLCGLCGAGCPESLRPDEMFLEMRRTREKAGALALKPYAPVLNFEKRGDSERYSLIKLPEGGDTVLFPGCALPASRPKTVRRLFQALQGTMPDMGVALGCCMKPSHDLGRTEFFEERFGRLHDALVAAGVKRVVTTCPNCQKVFSLHGGAISTTTAYEMLADSGFAPSIIDGGEAVIHDPCPQRYDGAIQDAVRTLARRSNIKIAEMENTREMTRCCGEGGMVKFVRPEFADRWTDQRRMESQESRMLTSCAGCTSFLGGPVAVDHVLDVLFDSKPRFALKGPFASIVRLKLKRWFQKTIS